MKPFLQWPGGKARVAPLLLPHFDLPCKRFIEPLCGAASMSLAVAEAGGAEEFWLNDINRDLMNCLWWAGNNAERLIQITRDCYYNDEHNNEMAYYQIRDLFNQKAQSEGLSQATIFLYLDFHCYNALIRYNSKGEFNSPYRKDRKIAAFPEQAIRNFAQLMSGTRFTCRDFKEVMAEAGPGDVIYCDPPYIPLSATANFTSYSKGKFGPREQKRLAMMAREAAFKGARVVINNHDTPKARELYAGAEIHELQVHRSISCNGKTRGKVGEIVAVFG